MVYLKTCAEKLRVVGKADINYTYDPAPLAFLLCREQWRTDLLRRSKPDCVRFSKDKENKEINVISQSIVECSLSK
jgi:hypothetical protein